MARPPYVWRLDELQDGKTLHTSSDETMELKVAGDTYRVWLVQRPDGPYVRVEELVDSPAGLQWNLAEIYKAEPQRTKLLSAPM